MIERPIRSCYATILRLYVPIQVGSLEREATTMDNWTRARYSMALIVRCCIWRDQAYPEERKPSLLPGEMMGNTRGRLNLSEPGRGSEAGGAIQSRGLPARHPSGWELRLFHGRIPQLHDRLQQVDHISLLTACWIPTWAFFFQQNSSHPHSYSLPCPSSNTNSPQAISFPPQHPHPPIPF